MKIAVLPKLQMEDHFTILNAWDNSQAFYPSDRIETINGKLMMKGSGGNMDYLIFGTRKVNEVNLTLGVKVLLEPSWGKECCLIMRTRVEANPKGEGDLMEMCEQVFPNFAYNAKDTTRVRHELVTKLPAYVEYIVPLATDVAYAIFLSHLHQFRGMEAVKTPEEVKEYFHTIFTTAQENLLKYLEGQYVPPSDNEDYSYDTSEYPSDEAMMADYGDED